MWLVYLILTLDAVTKTALAFSITFGSGLCISTICSWVATAQQNQTSPDFDKNDEKVINKVKNLCLGIFIPCLFISMFVPNSKQLAIIYTAGNAIEYVQGNEKIKELPNKAVQCLDKFVDEYLNEEKE